MALSLQEFLKILQDIPDLKPKLAFDKIKPDTRFREDLGFDSLAMASLFYTLQDLYSDLSEEKVTQWKTVQNCLDSVP
ncbi:MAG: phosphopantetheine-binding protein [Pseudobdellovibrionaceae bacterium]|jgi:acyl carrier protein